MRVLRPKVTLYLAAVMLIAGAAFLPSFANCGGSIGIFQGPIGMGPVNNCGNNAIGEFWLHKNGTWNLTTGGTGTPSGIDSGAFQDNLLLGGPPGSYIFNSDWVASGVDGCPLLTLEAASNPCNAGGDLGPTDFVIVGEDDNPAPDPHFSLVKAVFGSVDLNECGANYFIDNVGGGGADACPAGGCADLGPDMSCAIVPAPSVTGFSNSPGVTHFTINFPAMSVPYNDDCNNAASRASDCPRNLNAGRVLVVKRGPCNPVLNPPRPTRKIADYVNNGTASTRTERWHPFSPGDANYDGLSDATLAPNAITLCPGANCNRPTAAAQSLVYDFPVITGAPTSADNCVYIGVAVAGDSLPTAGHTQWLAPLVSMNNAPLNPQTPGAASDRVINLVASKTGSKANVTWATSAEFSTSGFEIQGSRKAGGSIQLNSSLIAAKEGTTGKGASYSVDLSAGDLKGASKVSVVVVLTDGTKVTYGPVAIQ